MQRPGPAEHIPYYEKYISLVREGEDVLKLLEEQPLPGVDFESYAALGEHDRRTLAEMLQEFGGLRRSHVAMFRAMGEEASRRIGTADGNPVSPRALAYILAGHVRYHAQLLEERYGVQTLPP